MRWILLIITCLNTALSYSQDSLFISDTENAIRSRNITLDFGLSNFNQKPDESTETNLKGNRSFNACFFQRINPEAEHIQFRIGIGVSLENYSFKRDVSPLPISDSTIFSYGNSYKNDSINFRKAKLSLNYIDIPFEVVFQQKNKTGVPKLILGTRLGWLFDAHSKRVIDINGSIVKEKVKADFNLNKLRFSLTCRLMYKGFNLFYMQNMTPLFREGKGPELTTCTGGISISIQ